MIKLKIERKTLSISNSQLLEQYGSRKSYISRGRVRIKCLEDNCLAVRRTLYESRYAAAIWKGLESPI